MLREKARYCYAAIKNMYPNTSLSYDEFNFIYTTLLYSENYSSAKKAICESNFGKDYSTLQMFLLNLKAVAYRERDIFVYDFGHDSEAIERLSSNAKKIELLYLRESSLDVKIKYLTSNPFSYEEYTAILTEEEQHSFDVIEKMVESNMHNMHYLFSYIKEEDRIRAINMYTEAVYKHARSKLTEEEVELIVNEIRKTDKIFLSHDKDKYKSDLEAVLVFHKSPLLDKLKKMYGKSYVEKTKNSLDDDETFLRTMLNSNVLNRIYENPYFNDSDITAVNGIITMYEERGEDTKVLRERIENLKKELCKRQRDFSLYILRNASSEEKLKDILKHYNITENNYYNYIVSSKFIDKKIKESVLLILSKYYSKNYISVYDILDYIQEAHESDKTLEQVLEEHKIDIQQYKESLKNLKEVKPALYKLITESEKRYSKNTKKIIELYESIMENKITDYESFIKYYKISPDKILEEFKGTPLFDNAQDLLKWYQAKEEDADKPRNLAKSVTVE